MTIDEKFPPPRPWTSDERIMKLGRMPHNYATTPQLRLRAIVEAGELLAQVGFRPYDHYDLWHTTTVPEGLVMRCREALTHFPAPIEIYDAVKGNYPIQEWLAIDEDVWAKWIDPAISHEPRGGR